MKLRKLATLCALIILAISLSACSVLNVLLDDSAITFEDGDSFDVKLSSSNHEFEWDFTDESQFYIFEGNEVLFLCEFFAEDGVVGYISSYAEKDDNAEINSISKVCSNNGIKYAIAPYYDEEDGEIHHEITGWICGSNTGFFGILTGDEKLVDDIFSALTFEVDDTTQTNKNYYPDAFDKIECK